VLSGLAQTWSGMRLAKVQPVLYVFYNIKVLVVMLTLVVLSIDNKRSRCRIGQGQYPMQFDMSSFGRNGHVSFRKTFVNKISDDFM
jgi:hypothetical protein